MTSLLHSILLISEHYSELLNNCVHLYEKTYYNVIGKQYAPDQDLGSHLRTEVPKYYSLII